MIRPTSVSDFYMPMLLNLSDDDKLDIIAKLTSTMRSSSKKKHTRPNLLNCFSGDWDNEKSSTEVADELRASRYFEEKDLTW